MGSTATANTTTVVSAPQPSAPPAPPSATIQFNPDTIRSPVTITGRISRQSSAYAKHRGAPAIHSNQQQQQHPERQRGRSVLKVLDLSSPYDDNKDDEDDYNDKNINSDSNNNNGRPRRAVRTISADIESALNADDDDEDRDNSSKSRSKSFIMNAPRVRRHIPFFIPLLTVAQVGLFIATVAVGGFEQVWINPMIGPPAETLLRFGAKGSEIREKWELWRLLTAFMLHSGIVHILFNMVWQLTVALRIELYWGGFRLMPIYILSGISGNLLSAAIVPQSVSSGASSCLAGLNGALLADIILNWHVLPSPWKNLVSMAFQLIVLLVIGWIPFVDNFAHIGGILAGFLVAMVVAPRLGSSPSPKKAATHELLALVRSALGRKKRSVTYRHGNNNVNNISVNRSVNSGMHTSNMVNTSSELEPGDVSSSSISVENAKRSGGARSGNGSGSSSDRWKLSKHRRFIVYTALRLASLVLLVLYFGIIAAMFFGLVDYKCGWCYYLNPDWEFFFGDIQ